MEDIPKPSSLWRADPSGDVPGTISDLGLWLKDAFFLPGDWLIWATATYAAPVAEFLEIGANDYGSVLSGFLSALAWILLVIVAGVTYGAIRDFDRRLTDGVERLYAEVRRRLRVAGALLVYRLRRLRPEAPKSEAIELSEEIKLSNDELRVLRLHGQLKAGYALAVSEVMAALKISGDHARQVLGRLKQLNLVASTVGGREGESAYRLTRAGQAFLVFRQLESRPAQGNGRQPPQKALKQEA
jgi:hypothetical protein